jgi:hypothetical protein
MDPRLARAEEIGLSTTWFMAEHVIRQGSGVPQGRVT